MSTKYDDIIHLPRFISKNRKHMSNHDRAAQFAPFAALTGYEDSIEEVGRLVSEEIELSESSLEILNQKLQIIQERIHERPKIIITHFIPDLKKKGGSYLKEEIEIRKIDFIERILITIENKKYSIDYIVDMEGEILKIDRE